MKFRWVIAAFVFYTIVSLNCSSSSKEFTERKFIIASKQTIEVRELGLSITNYGCGRQWQSTDGKNGTEKPYCELEIKYKDSIINAGNDYKPIFIGQAEIQLDKINPWGREEDSIPPGGCRVWVRRLPGH